MDRYSAETPTSVVRSYFSKFKFGTVKNCKSETGLKEDQIRASIKVLRQNHEIEYRGKHGQGIYVLRGYGSDARDQRRQRMVSLIEANEKYRDSVASQATEEWGERTDRAEEETQGLERYGVDEGTEHAMKHMQLKIPVNEDN